MSPDNFVDQLRKEFPILENQLQETPLVYLDNAATNQKPQTVIDAICDYYQHNNANVHRASHSLSNQSTQLFEASREKARHFINAKRIEEIIWTKGTTEGLNLLANTLTRSLSHDDEVMISALEHHANIVPWQMAAQRIGFKLIIIPLNAQQELDFSAFEQLLSDKTKILSIAHVSNTLGVVNPIQDMISLAHQVGAKVVVDGAQAVAHLDIDVQALDCDFYLFSGHKMYGPTGIGVLYGKYNLLDQLPPWQGGGEMIKQVSFDSFTTNQLPFKFEPGTPNIAGVVGLGAAFDFIDRIDKTQRNKNEQWLIAYAQSELNKLAEVTILAEGSSKVGALSFVVKDEHCADVGMLLNAQGIAVRSGSHCAMPLMKEMQLPGTVRLSFAIYNTKHEVDQFIKALKKVICMLNEE